MDEPRVESDVEVVHRIARQALVQWQKAVRGLVAFPAAVALTWATGAMYVGLFLDRRFDADRRVRAQPTGAGWPTVAPNWNAPAAAASPASPQSMA
jgi:hypothetical protein